MVCHMPAANSVDRGSYLGVQAAEVQRLQDDGGEAMRAILEGLLMFGGPCAALLWALARIGRLERDANNLRGTVLRHMGCLIDWDPDNQRKRGERMHEPIHRETDIIQWAEDRNIFEGGTAVTQLAKLREEVRELNDAVVDENTPEIIDGIGDVVVCLVIQASFHGLSMAECIEHAWQQIKDRKGRLVDGVFQKGAT